MQRQYRVYIQPKINATTYGTEIEVSDLIAASSSSITRSVDSQDFDIGIYSLSEMDVVADNSSGYFNDQTDTRSLFTFSRDLAKVRMTFYNNGVETSSFRGLISDDATSNDLETNLITLKVLSRDSIFNRVNIPAGLISSGTTAKNALISVLSISSIAAILNVVIGNINPANPSITVDDGTQLDNQPAKSVVEQLLFAMNSLITIDNTDTVYVKDRTEDTAHSVLYLYGRYSSKGSENISRLQGFNTGLQRLFNSVAILNTNGGVLAEAHNQTSVDTYGTRQKQLQFSWVTNSTNAQNIVNSIRDTFAFPKYECQVTVPIDVTAGIDLLKRVSVDFPLQVTPQPGKRLPIIGITQIGDANFPLPIVSGALSLTPNIGWKVIEMIEDTAAWTTQLKLRQIGTTLQDGQILPFEALDYGTPVFWFEPRQTSKAVITGGFLSGFLDSSPNGNNASQSNPSYYPLYPLFGLNNFPAIQLSKNNSGLDFGSAQILNSAQPFTIGMVVAQGTYFPGTQYPVFLTLKSDLAENVSIGFSNDPSFGPLFWSSGGSWKSFTSTAIAYGDTNPHVIILTYNGSGYTNVANYTLYVDGVLATIAGASAGSPGNTGNNFLGGRNGATDLPFDGLSGSVFCFQSLFSSVQINRATAALKQQWGIS